MKRFNLMATTLRGQEPLGISSLVEVLADLGDPEARVEITRVQGVLTAITKLDPFDVVERTRALAQREPWKVSGLMRLIPVERVVESKKESIVEVVEELKRKIPPDATYKVVVEKRHTQLSSRELIEAVASRVERRVDLSNPSWIVLIEVLGGLTGISVLRPSQVLSLTRL
ncbi:MAG: THUMP domain-containing protein [Thaumarchaeota archaeon]|nr:THUMP domain-containing protein [Candidatus Calditenuaceae archaeon]MDW8186817.1 THUMP domain-containing protein [Nitrososphaerota archaeon]